MFLRPFPTLLLVCLTLAPIPALGQGDPSPPLAHLDVDARLLPRKLLKASLRIPVEPRDEPWVLTLRYPQWVPGAHGPSGPVQNLAGLETRASGRPAPWARRAGDVYGIDVSVPARASSVEVRLTYLTNQPSTVSRGVDCYGSAELGVINFNCVVLYPEEAKASQWRLTTSVTLPREWKAASALPRLETGEQAPAGRRPSSPLRRPGRTVYGPVSLRRLVDSPLMCGRYMKTYDLVDPRVKDVAIPPHRLHVFSEVPGEIEVSPEVLAGYRDVVTQAGRLFGSFPFDSMDVLLATTDAIPRTGLEHSRSCFNVIPRGTLGSKKQLTGWNRMLVPHEYAHAWCGKFRRPAGMATDDFHSPKGTELLWVYEGLTQLLGNLLEVRSGLKSSAEFRWGFGRDIRWAAYQQGREWRPLTDTGAAAHTLRGGSPNWGHLRRSQDYYSEGGLIFLEIDALLKQRTANAEGGPQGLDDFCQAFFAAADRHPHPFSRETVVELLEQLCPAGPQDGESWSAYLARRVERPSKGQDMLQLAQSLGYQVRFVAERPRDPQGKAVSALDARDSLGARFGSDGQVRDVLLGSPADRAGLAPGRKVVAVGDYLWSAARLQQALSESPAAGYVRLLVADGDKLSRVTVAYRMGPRYFSLVRDRQAADPLASLLAPR